MRKPTFWFPTWSDTNQAVQLQKMARGLKFRIKKVEGSYCLSSENKGTDQLRGYCEADLRLCFCICKKPVFSRRGLIQAIMNNTGVYMGIVLYIFLIFASRLQARTASRGDSIVYTQCIFLTKN